MSDTPAKNEATRETVEFDYFGRSWSVPAQVRFSHREALEAHPTNVGIVLAFLDAKQVAALRAIDPTDDELDKFTDEIAAKTGLVSAGNS